MRKTTLLAALAVGAVLVATAVQAANPNARLATGNLYIGLLDPGRVTCIGGEPTPPGTFPLCTPETKRVVWRDHVGVMSMDAVSGPAAPWVPPVIQSLGNCNLDRLWDGPCWGTFEAEWLGGTWAGTYSGSLDFVGFAGNLKFVGHGNGGEIDGMQIFIEAACGPTGDPYAPMPFVVRVQKVDE